MLQKWLNRLSYYQGVSVFRLFMFATTLIFHQIFGFEIALFYILANISVSLIALESRTRPREVVKDEEEI
ncbi:hypothetical protein [Enterococcus casseliflavus]|uniref:hypothetical protein n=1 Tax=Enterococcus casseliflavus TaxID=37734 RepID=UPI0039A607E9